MILGLTIHRQPLITSSGHALNVRLNYVPNKENDDQEEGQGGDAEAGAVLSREAVSVELQ